jgi:hypothetical protein
VIPGLSDIEVAHADPAGRPCGGDMISHTHTYADRVWADDSLWTEVLSAPGLQSAALLACDCNLYACPNCFHG